MAEQQHFIPPQPTFTAHRPQLNLLSTKSSHPVCCSLCTRIKSLCPKTKYTQHNYHMKQLNHPNLQNSKSHHIHLHHHHNGINPLSLSIGFSSSDSSNSNGSNEHKQNHKKQIKNERKTVYKFENGEQFETFSYLIPQRIIGEGSYASVCSAIHIGTKQKYAIKKNRNAFASIGTGKRILRELKLMKHFVGHPNLMSMLDVIPPNIGTQQTYNDVYIIMPKMHINLKKLIEKSKIAKIKLCEHDIQSIMYQICRGLEYMHSANVIHRDIKPENILISCYYHSSLNSAASANQKTKIWQVKLTDFGLARGTKQSFLNGSKHKFASAQFESELTEYVVTRYYRAPEIMCCSRSYDSQIDVWSVGCLFGEIFYKKALFRGTNHLHQLQLLFYFCGTPTDLEWITTKECKQWIAQLPKHKRKNFQKEFGTNTDDGMSDDAADLLNNLLILNPTKRWNMTRTLKHSFFKSVYKENDYRKCKLFDTSFEAEPILRTNFGVRHMVFEELQRIHKGCRQQQQKY